MTRTGRSVTAVTEDLGLNEADGRSLARHTLDFLRLRQNLSEKDISRLDFWAIERLAKEFLQETGHRFFSISHRLRYIWPHDEALLVAKIGEIMSRQKDYQADKVRKSEDGQTSTSDNQSSAGSAWPTDPPRKRIRRSTDGRPTLFYIPAKLLPSARSNNANDWVLVQVTQNFMTRSKCAPLLGQPSHFKESKRSIEDGCNAPPCQPRTLEPATSTLCPVSLPSTMTTHRAPVH